MGPFDTFPWGKIHIAGTSATIDAALPLPSHCLDVAATFHELAVLPTIRRRLNAAAGVTLSDAHLDRLSVMALLHDLGKANLGFQDKVFDPKAPRAGHVRELAPLFFEEPLQEVFAHALDHELLATWFDSPAGLEGFLLATWSHHGRPVTFDQACMTGNYFLAKTQWWLSDGRRDPMVAVAELLELARRAFPGAFSSDIPPIPTKALFQHRFAGLVMLADWVGSHQGFFPIDRPDHDPATFSRRAAGLSVRSIGLDPRLFRETLHDHPFRFKDSFGFDPYPFQASLADRPADDPESRLLIAEAETGSGKTEAALARFFTLFAAGEVDSLYFALPTRVAARELYGRVARYLERTFPTYESRPAAVLAVPGYARVDNIPMESLLPEESARWQDDDGESRRERLWAAEHPKRFLASTVAVGTIDQALLSAVQTSHAHLRSVCLDRSLLVVDEVHASDAYMRRLLTGLLRHHVGLGGHALLLSATLGAAARTDLLAAAGLQAHVPDFTTACATPYPAITDHTGTTSTLGRPQERRQKTVQFDLRNCLVKSEGIVPEIAQALTLGARVLVVLNTVGRAIALQRTVEAEKAIPKGALFDCEGAICLHHGRFAPSDRELLDRAVSSRWGKGSDPGPLLLIGTQTLEQSLDIDADLLITDLCPIDVLLQRIGRLHRHDRQRPRGFETPRCVVLAPGDESLERFLDARGEPVSTAKAAGLGSVYEDLRTLELTRLLLLKSPEVQIPRDNRALVEGATHPERLAMLVGDRWSLHGQSLEGVTLARTIAALSAAAIYDKPFGGFVFQELNVRARTRLGLDSLRVPLAEAFPGPFGQPIKEILVPGHLAPKKFLEDTATVEGLDSEGMVLRYEDRRYRYSRFGLEKADEPAN